MLFVVSCTKEDGFGISQYLMDASLGDNLALLTNQSDSMCVVVKKQSAMDVQLWLDNHNHVLYDTKYGALTNPRFYEHGKPIDVLYQGDVNGVRDLDLQQLSRESDVKTAKLYILENNA